jgi:hypothetical protein
MVHCKKTAAALHFLKEITMARRGTLIADSKESGLRFSMSSCVRIAGDQSKAEA